VSSIEIVNTLFTGGLSETSRRRTLRRGDCSKKTPQSPKIPPGLNKIFYAEEAWGQRAGTKTHTLEGKVGEGGGRCGKAGQKQMQNACQISKCYKLIWTFNFTFR